MGWNPGQGSPPAKVLLIQWRRIGDAVLVTPVLDTLRESWPGASLHLLVSLPALDLFTGDPRVSVLWGRPGKGRLPRLAAALQRERFDLVFDFQSLVTSALLARSTGGFAVGYAKRGRGRLFHRSIPSGSHQGTGYAADHKLDLLRALGIAPRGIIPRLVPPPGTSPLWDRLPGGPRVALVPVSLRASKCWSPEAFAATAVRLHARTGATFVLAGGPSEDEALAAVAAGLGRVPHIVQTLRRVREMAELLAGADLFLGNDNGPRHVAMALGIPTLAWFGPQNPTFWTPPGSPAHRVLWNPSQGQGMRLREDLVLVPDRPEAAADAAADLLAVEAHRR
jgi:ADP-heptose:LPS heptosyltransferase